MHFDANKAIRDEEEKETERSSSVTVKMRKRRKRKRRRRRKASAFLAGGENDANGRAADPLCTTHITIPAKTFRSFKAGSAQRRVDRNSLAPLLLLPVFCSFMLGKQ